MQIDYNALANLPQSDKTLTKSGNFADAKAVGDKLNQLSEDFGASEEKLNTLVENFGTSEDGAINVGGTDDEYHISVDDSGITFWHGTTKVAHIENDTFTASKIVGAVYA